MQLSFERDTSQDVYYAVINGLPLVHVDICRRFNGDHMRLMCRDYIISRVLRCFITISLFMMFAVNPVYAVDDGISKLLKAYPEQLCKAEGNVLVWCDGTRMLFDEGNGSKNHQQKLEHADLRDQMEQCYPRGAIYAQPATDFEPGRIRNEAFFKKMYGGSAGEVQKNLVSIIWLPSSNGQRFRITSINRINEHLQAVSDELDKLPPDLKRFVNQPAGSFNWRVIAAEKRLSPHSFGIAFDINTATANYWFWSESKDRRPSMYQNRIPIEIVLIFEKHGFIWGGKWNHYDTMHFEYRAELLLD